MIDTNYYNYNVVVCKIFPFRELYVNLNIQLYFWYVYGNMG